MKADVYYTKNKVHTLASQVYILATGLQNAAPPGTTGKSIQYLFEAAALLEQVSAKMDALVSDEGDQSTS